MKLIRWGPIGAEKPGLLLPDGSRVDASGFGRDYDTAFFGDDGPDALRRWAERNAAAAPRVDPSVRLGPPVARPSKIVCVGLNYRDHAAESKMPIPAEPVLFMKAPTALAGPEDALAYPPWATKLDWEVELAVVIGRRAKLVPEARALDHVAGYAMMNDVSERAAQLERGGQWVKGKSYDGFAPLGPFVATRDEIRDPQALKLWLKVNGQIRQQGSTADMVFGVVVLVSYISRFMTLLPGDVISTGTPAGVGNGLKPPVFLKPGDVMELGVEGLGQARQKVEESP
jgi:2-keto-4-pentenoate hydratase/2-oxohepta-3-ene-1,7-dioic acid hydratase in catechol pathway